MNESYKSTKTWITEGLLTATIPLLGYLISFLYEAGFCSAFNIPYQLIRLNINTIFIATGALIFFLFSYLFIVDNIFTTFLMTYYKENNIIWYKIKILSPFWILLLGLFFMLLGCNLWKQGLFLLAALIMVIFFEFGFPLISQKKQKTYFDKLKAQDLLDCKIQSPTSIF